MAQPGKLDGDLKEFWVEHAAQMVRKGENLSAYERNRTYLNVRGKDFLDISFLTGTDSDGDGRAVVAGDFRNTGQLDLIVRQVGGGAFLFFENDFPKRNYLKVSFRGVNSNRLGVGARVTATTKGLVQLRENYPINSYQSQAAKVVHFGLGGAAQVDKLEVLWPSGHKQVFKNIKTNQHILVDESKKGPAAISKVRPGVVSQP